MSEEMIVDEGPGRQRTVKVDYPANSRKAKEATKEREPVEKVVTTEVIKRKRSLLERITGSFIAEDSGTVTQYVVMEVLLPAAKNMISDAVSQGIERMLFGDARPRSGGRTAYTNYQRPFTTTGRNFPGERDPRTPLSRQARATHNFSDIVIASRGEAEDVLDGLRELISQFDVATVSDLYDLAGLTSEFTDNKWGWYDLRSAQVRPVRGGYMLTLPRTQPIV